MNRPQHAVTALPRLRALVPLWLLLAALGAMALAAYGTQPTAHIEVEATQGIQAVDPAPLRWSAEFLTVVGNDPWYSLFALAAIGAMYFWARRPSLAVFLALAVMLRAVSPMIKAIVDRPRPDASLIDVASELGSASYPSGHVLGATLLCGFLVYCVERTVARVALRRGLQAGLIAAILLMGHARVEMGHHWPTDVVGGWLIGSLIVAGLVWGHRRWEARRASTGSPAHA